MLTLNDGRKELYQWDTGRTATVAIECDVVHFANLKYGESLAVEVKVGKVSIPNQLLMSGEPIYCWAFVKDESGTYTKKEQTFVVIKRAKPSDYLYTETEVISVKTAVNQGLEEAKESGEFKGDKGDAGVSPTVSVTAIDGGHQVDITDSIGTKTFSVMDGKDGEPPIVDIGFVPIYNPSSVWQEPIDATNSITFKPTMADSYIECYKPMSFRVEYHSPSEGSGYVFHNDYVNWDYNSLSFELYFHAFTAAKEKKIAKLVYAYDDYNSLPKSITAYLVEQDPNVLFVTVADGKASHTSTEIAEYVNKGYTVYLNYQGKSFALSAASSSLCEFSFMDAENQIAYTWKIDANRSAELFKADVAKEVTLDYANNTFANALKGSASGPVILIDDVSPVTPNMGVKISSNTITDLTAVKVKRCGKNLIPYPYANLTRTINGVTFTVNSDSTITANGTATNNAYFEITSISTFYIPKGNYILSGCPSGGSASTYSLAAANGSGISYTKFRQDIGNGITLSSSGEYWLIRCQVKAGQTVENIVFKPQIELGTAVTDYDPYITPTEYTPNADGTVNGVTSLYPNTTLTTDTEGVIIDCEYNRDINKAFAELQAAIISLGGNI